MGLHKPFDRHFFVIGGATKTTGGSLQLTKGQFGIFDIQDTSVNGAKAVSSFKGQPKNKLYELKVGNTDTPVTRSNSNKANSSFPFKLSNVVDLRVSAPERTKQEVDEVIVGYNGIDPTTSLTFGVGDKKKMVVRLEGESIGLLGYNNNMVDIPVYMDAEGCSPYRKDCQDCDPCIGVDCLPIVLNAIETLKNHQLRGGMKVSDFVDVTPIRECNTNPTLTEIPYKFYCLEVCDTGDETALALIQAQYEDIKLVRTGRIGAISSYQFLQPASVPAPKDFEQTLPSIIKGCANCPDGYTEAEGGLVYAVTLEDDGTDESSTVESLANTVDGSAIKTNTQHDGVGYYTVVLTESLSDEDFDTFIESNPTATITFVGEVSAICNNDTVNTVSWTECGECTVTEQTYTIVLPDTDCGEDRLVELQKHYPNLEIELEGTTGGCQTKYITTVTSNLVCEECDPIFKDYYKTETPSSYDGRQWTLEGDSLEGSDCKCGIRLKGKVLEVHPDECLRDDLGFTDSSVMIRVSGGFLTEVRAGDEQVDDSFHTEYVSRWKRRTHLGGNFWNFEDRSRVFFTGEARHQGDLVARMFKGEESALDSDKQYVDYAVTIRRDWYTQSFGSREEDNITYHVIVEVGRHQSVEDLLNSLAAAAGITTVQAFGK